MSNPAALGAIEYEVESAWGDNVTTFATHRMPLVAMVDASGLVHNKVAPDATLQYRNDGALYVQMTMGGSFKIKMDLPGHGATTSGSPTVDAIETYLGRVFGNVALSATASTTGVTAGSTVTVPVTAASGTFAAGSLCRIGTGGVSQDSRGNGQFLPISTHVGTALTLLADMDAAINTADVVYPVVGIYPSETPTTTSITGTRFRLLTANLRYECHGCFPMAVALTGLNPGERPQIEVTWGVSWWAYSTATFPSTVTSNRYNPAPIAAGSIHVQDVGTTTRNKRTLARNFTIDYKLGIEPLKGYGGVSINQDIVGAVRTPDQIDVSWTEDADAATLTPVLAGYGTGTTFKLIMATLSVTAGSALGFLLRRVCITNIATQKADGNINRLTVTGRAHTGLTTTNDQTLTAFVMGFA